MFGHRLLRGIAMLVPLIQPLAFIPTDDNSRQTQVHLELPPGTNPPETHAASEALAIIMAGAARKSLHHCWWRLGGHRHLLMGGASTEVRKATLDCGRARQNQVACAQAGGALRTAPNPTWCALQGGRAVGREGRWP